METKILKTDTNFTRIPFFTTTKSVKITEPTTEKIEYLNNDGSKTALNVKYSGIRKPTFFDRRVLSSIEYAFIEKYENQFILMNDEIEKEIEKLVKDRFNNKKLDELNISDRQFLIYIATETVALNYNMILELKTVNDLLYTNSKSISKTKIKESIGVLNNTEMLMNTTYDFDKEGISTIDTSIPLIYNSITQTNESKSNKKMLFNIRLNPLHFYNIVNGRYTYLDLNLLNSFNSPIAGRLYEFIKPKLYKPVKSKRNKITLTYDAISSQLRLKKHSKKSYIERQLIKPFEELISKGVIYEYIFIKGLYDIEIDFSNNLDFFKQYNKQLSDKEYNKITSIFMELKQNDKKSYKKYEQKAHRFLDRNDGFKKLSKEKKEDAIEYYIRYLLVENEINE